MVLAAPRARAPRCPRETRSSVLPGTLDEYGRSVTHSHAHTGLPAQGLERELDHLHRHIRWACHMPIPKSARFSLLFDLRPQQASVLNRSRKLVIQCDRARHEAKGFGGRERASERPPAHYFTLNNFGVQSCMSCYERMKWVPSREERLVYAEYRILQQYNVGAQ